MKDEYCSLVADPIAKFTTDCQLQGRRHHPIPIYSSNADERDQVMENLQKLLDTHQQRRALNLDSLPGCSNNNRSLLEDVGDIPSTSSDNNSKQNIPLFLSLDAKSSILKNTMIDGLFKKYFEFINSEQILSCFVIGGECRLCFPQMRALCLGNISTQKIDETMKALAIINPHASEEQLNVLKKNNVVPQYLSNCELITKTNAQRLAAILKLDGIPRPIEFQNNDFRQQLHSIKVAHDCFGGCKGVIYPAMAPNPCLECVNCHLMFKPKDFCRHSHQPIADKNTCFWGFDTSNWPYYIRIDDEDIAITNGYGDAENQLANFIQNYPATLATLG